MATAMARNEQPLLFGSIDDPGQLENVAPHQPRGAERMKSLLRTSPQELHAPADQLERLKPAPAE